MAKNDVMDELIRITERNFSVEIVRYYEHACDVYEALLKGGKMSYDASAKTNVTADTTQSNGKTAN